MVLSHLAQDVVDEGIGHHHRADPVLPGTGGPAGNAQLTAWTGLVLLVAMIAELLTVLDLRGLINWHVGIGIALIPPVLLKTATTGWRVVRYYRGNEPYHQAGPPPMVLRLLGPLVVVFTLALLGSGLVLILLGPQASRNTLLTVLGQRINARTVHVGLAVCWAAVTGLHVLGRLLPALLLTTGRRRSTALPGVSWRVAALLATVLAAAVAVTLVLPVNAGWTQDRGDGRAGPAGQQPGSGIALHAQLPKFLRIVSAIT